MQGEAWIAIGGVGAAAMTGLFAWLAARTARDSAKEVARQVTPSNGATLSDLVESIGQTVEVLVKGHERLWNKMDCMETRILGLEKKGIGHELG